MSNKKRDTVWRFIEAEHRRGKTLIESYGVGGAHAFKGALAQASILHEVREVFSASYTASGGGIPIAPINAGMDPREVEKVARSLTLSDIIDEHSIYKRILAGVRRYRKNDKIGGLNNGDALCGVIRSMVCKAAGIENVPGADTFARIRMQPTLRILATPASFDHGGNAYVFSAEQDPHVSVSNAVMASSADRWHFFERIVPIRRNGTLEEHAFIDAATIEPLPMASIVRDAIAQGRDPADLTIVAVIPVWDFGAPSRSFVRHEFDVKRNQVVADIRFARAHGARVIAIQPNVDMIEKSMKRLMPEAFERHNALHAKAWYKFVDVEQFPILYPRFEEVVEDLLYSAAQVALEHPKATLITSKFERVNGRRVLVARAREELALAA